MNVNIGQFDALPPEIIQNKQFSRLNIFPRSSSDRLSNNFRMTNQSKISLTNKWAVERDKILGNGGCSADLIKSHILSEVKKVFFFKI